VSFLPTNIENLGVAALLLVLCYLLALRAGTFAGLMIRDWVSSQAEDRRVQTEILSKIASRFDIAEKDIDEAIDILSDIRDKVTEGKCRSTQS
jgi:hypothetical protein